MNLTQDAVWGYPVPEVASWDKREPSLLPEVGQSLGTVFRYQVSQTPVEQRGETKEAPPGTQR